MKKDPPDDTKIVEKLRKWFSKSSTLDTESKNITSHLDEKTAFSQLRDWQKGLDLLQPLVRSMRNDIDSLGIHQLTFDILGAGTFLLQIDLLLIKIRQHYNNYERRKKELNVNIPAIAQLMKRVEQGCILCYKNILQLQSLLQNRTYKDLNHHEVINQVHSLETETKSLTQCMVALSEMALKRDPLYQLFEAELFKTLMHLESSDTLPASHLALEYERGSSLRDKAHRIKDSEKRKIAFNLISYYETLKRANNLSQSDASIHAIESFKKRADLFLDISLNDEPGNKGKDVILLLFHDLEAMRFLKSKGIFEKSSTIRKQFKQLLQQSLFGKECLKELQMSPRSKMLLRSKF